jgi:hypothetical protein
MGGGEHEIRDPLRRDRLADVSRILGDFPVACRGFITTKSLQFVDGVQSCDIAWCLRSLDNARIRAIIIIIVVLFVI